MSTRAQARAMEKLAAENKALKKEVSDLNGKLNKLQSTVERMADEKLEILFFW